MNDKIKAIIYGTAYGDAWGKKLELLTYEEISRINATPFPSYAYITDDTQMCTYVLQGISNSKPSIQNIDKTNINDTDVNNIRVNIATQLLKWNTAIHNTTPDPINAQALNNLATYIETNPTFTGTEGANNKSQSYGVNIRGAWFGVLPYTTDTIEELALIQTEITHNSPLALATSVITALYVEALKNNRLTVIQNENLGFQYIKNLTNALITKNETTSRPKYLQGLKLFKNFLKTKEPLYNKILQTEITQNLWKEFNLSHNNSDELLLMSIFILDKYYDSPVDCLYYAVRTSAKSNSLAALVGVFVGATDDVSWPDEWKTYLQTKTTNELNKTIRNIYLL